MTKTELGILGKCIKELIRTNRGLWDNLKREIFDRGYQSCYQSQDYFNKPAIKAVLSLKKEIREKLIYEWKRRPRLIKRKMEGEILNQYALIIVEAIVNRARFAQARTIYW